MEQKFIDKFSACITELQNIYKHFIESKLKELGFNCFELMSDKYHYENLHSDILKEFLDDKGKHGEGDKFFKLFVELLNDVNPKLKIAIEDFTDYEVKREDKRIDISIIDEISKKAIIIENKINKAVDQPRQLPRYVEVLERDDYEIIAVVYLTLGTYGKPNKKDWIRQDGNQVKDEQIVETIENTFVKVVAHQEPAETCISSWLEKCKCVAKDADVSSVLKQYVKLIEYLGKEAINMKDIGEFYSLLSKNKIKPEEIKSMVDKIPQYFIEKIHNNIKNEVEEFNKTCSLTNKGNCIAVTPFHLQQNKNFTLKMQMEAFCSGINVWIWKNNYENNEDSLQTVKTFFDAKGNYFDFKYPQKDTSIEKREDYSRFFAVDFFEKDFLKEVSNEIIELIKQLSKNEE